MKFFLLLLTISSLSLIEPVFSMEDPWVDSTQEEIEEVFRRATQLKPMKFQDVGFKKGKQFTRTESPAFIECSEAKTDFNAVFSCRSFSIKEKEKETDVGSIGIIYHPRDRVVDIDTLEVLKDHRRKGYGESALRTVLGVCRAESRDYLTFDYFTLTVFKDEAHAPARELFKKLGFEVETDGELAWKMRLKR